MTTDRAEAQTANSRRYIVVFDDGHGVCWLMGWDGDCDGAISAMGRAAAMFASRQDAILAIRVSTAFAKLCKAQGKPANSDFLEGIKCVKVIPCEL